MQDSAKTREQLIVELHELRERIAELEKNRAEKTLQESNDRFRRLVDSIPGMIFQFVLREDGSFALPYVSERIMQYAGILPEQVMAEPSLIFTPIHPDDREMMQQAISISARTLHDFSVEHRLIDVDGQLRWFRVESRPQRLSNGDILWNGVSIDITGCKLAEQSLRESEDQLKTLVQSAPDAIFVQMEGRFAYVNDMAIRLYGAASEKELLGRDVMERVHPDYRAKILERIRSANEEWKPTSLMEQKHVKLDGTIMDVEAISTPIRYRKSEGALVLVRDVTERKQTEESLLLSEDRYRRLFEDAVLGIYRSTPAGKILRVNPAFARMYGFGSPEEAKSQINDVAVDLYVDPSRRNEMVRMILSGEEPVHCETLYRRKDGSVFTGNLHAWAVRDREGKLLYLEGFVEDITERKRAEEALQESRARLAATIESIPFEFWVIGSDGRYAMQNRICRERYGDIIGKRPEDICRNETILSIWRNNNCRAFSGEVVKGEVKLDFGEEQRYFYNIVAPIHDAGRTLGIVGIHIDITARKRLEAALKKVNEELEGQVEERTKELGAKTRSLEEFNAALKVLLKQRQEDRTELEESILLNVKSLIVPYVEKLKKSKLGGDQMTYLTILDSHVREIISPFAKRLSEKHPGLTPVEVQTVGLIREGKTTQEIADLLCVSENTVSSNRFHIRKKLGLTNKKVNLRYYLQSIDK